MNRDEEMAESYLRSLAPTYLRFEPNGHSTSPDFEVCFNDHQSIGVEVRRLNHNSLHISPYAGLDEVNIPLMQRMRRLAKTMRAPSAHRWFLCYGFKRTVSYPRGPLSQWDIVKRYFRVCFQRIEMAAAEPLGEFGAEYVSHAPETLSILHFIRGSESTPGQVLLGSIQDLDTSGWCQQQLQDNIGISLTEKTAKRGQWSESFPCRWLLLVDHIAYGAPEKVSLEHDWDKVVVINPLNPLEAYEL